MFIRARKPRSSEANPTYQLVHSYRGADGRVRQEVVSVPSPTVAESLDVVRNMLRRSRREHERTARLAALEGASAWIRRQAQRDQRLIRLNEKRLAMLLEAKRQAWPHFEVPRRFEPLAKGETRRGAAT